MNKYKKSASGITFGYFILLNTEFWILETNDDGGRLWLAALKESDVLAYQQVQYAETWDHIMQSLD